MSIVVIQSLLRLCTHSGRARLDPSFVAVAMLFTAVLTGVVSVLAGTDTLSSALVAGAVLIFVSIIISGLADNLTKQKESTSA